MSLFYLNRTVNRLLIKYVSKKYFSKSSNVFGCGEKIREALFVPVQKERPKKYRKISIIGAAGAAGRTITYNIIRNRYICDEIAMIDIPEKRILLCGEALDFLHAGSTFGIPIIKIGLEPEMSAGSDLVILTAAIPRKQDQTILETIQPNVDIYKKIVPLLARLSPDCVFLVVSEHVDILSYATWRYSCFEKNRVMGIGTSIDSSRFRYYLSKRLEINPFSINANIVAEHGDSSVPVWSLVNVAGTRIRDIEENIGTSSDRNDWKEVYVNAKDAGANLIKGKGHISWGIGVAAAKIVEAVLRDYKTVHHVSINAKGLCDIETDCFLSFPVVLGNRGVYQVVQQVYDELELDFIAESVCKLQEISKKIKF